MKRKTIIFLVLITLISLGLIIVSVLKQKTVDLTFEKPTKQAQSKAEKNNPNNKTNAVYKTSSIFIPYWALPQSKEDIVAFDRLMYFGISIHKDGVDKNDSGYKKLDAFQTITTGYTGNTSLVVRMLDAETNTTILNDENIQTNVIAEINEIIKEKGFTEIALDLELSGIYKVDVTDKINSFVQKIYTLKNKHYRRFSVIIYGDVFYRNRPFDVETIGKNCDEIMVMAYDFSKAYGEPGPNMPFTDKQIWGYDFKEMISDYTSEVSLEKLTVIFGMYGYDWTLNKQGIPLKRGEAVTLNQINVKSQNSKVKNTTQNSKEKKIEYSDAEGQKHVIWYEDEESAQVKTLYLEEKGIGSVGYWAYSYY